MKRGDLFEDSVTGQRYRLVEMSDDPQGWPENVRAFLLCKACGARLPVGGKAKVCCPACGCDPKTGKKAKRRSGC